MEFEDRRQAGRALARRLQELAPSHAPLILALPRGGVPVGFEVAQGLHAPLDVWLVRKLGVPGHEELAMGAIASGGVRILNDEVVRILGIPEEIIELVSRGQTALLQERERRYRGGRPPPEVRGRDVIVVDDGLATGASMRAAVASLRRAEAAHIAVAVPVAPAETCQRLSPEVDALICLATPWDFQGVGRWYQDFSEVTDEDVRVLLEAAHQETGARYHDRER